MDANALALQLFRLGAALPVALGLLHALLTLVDVVAPRFFTPVDDAVRVAMARSGLRLAPRMGLWDAWLGFNLSHGLGLVCFGLAVLLVSFADPSLVLGVTALSGLAAAASLSYLALAVRFWVGAVALGAVASFLCVAASAWLASPGLAPPW